MHYRCLYYLGTSVTLLCLLAACAPAPPHLDAEEIPMDPDLGALPAATGILPRPDPRPGFDCNDNDIEDAFDIAGLIPHGPYAVGHNPFYLTASDLDNNGAADIAVSNLADGTVTILWQHHRERRFDRSSTIHLNQPPANEAPPHPTCIAAGDIDGNGYNDLVVAPNDGRHRYVILLMNNGDRLFELETLQTPYASREFPRCVTVTDIDNDSDLDILAVSGVAAFSTSVPSEEHVTLFRNPGGGAFTSHSREVFETDIYDISYLTTANLNSDDYPEVILKGEFRLGIITNETDSGSRYSDWAFYRTPEAWDQYTIDAITAADIVADDGPNLVVLTRSDGKVHVLPNIIGVLGQQALDPRQEVGSGALSIGAGDINNDGDIDIMIPEPTNNSIALLRNRDNQELLPAQHLPVSETPTGIYVGNLDADNRLEIAVSNIGTDDVWVLHMRPEPVSRDIDGNGVPDSCEPFEPLPADGGGPTPYP